MKTVSIGNIEKTLISEIESHLEHDRNKEALAALRQSESQYSTILAGSAHFLQIKARVLNVMGDYKAALETSQAAYRIAKSDTDNDLIARIQTESAKAYLTLGKTNNAEREYHDVIAAYRRTGNINGIIDTLNRLAQIKFILSEFDASTRILQEALRCAEENELSDRIAKLTGNLGQIASMLGDYNRAVQFITVSITKNTELKLYPNLCRAYLSLAYAEIRLGNLDSARKSLRKTEGLIEKHNLTREFGIYHEYLADLEYELGNWDQALEAINITLEHGYNLSNTSALISQGERLRAEILIQKENYSEARNSAEKALEIAQEIGESLECGASYRILAELANIKNDNDKARELIRSSIELIQKSNAKYDLARAYVAAYIIFKGSIGDSQYYLQRARELYSSMKLDFMLSRSTPKDEFTDTNYEVASTDGQIINIITSDRRMKAIMRAVDSIKDSDIPILVGGETGTGKDQLAKYIHYSSKRRSARFISVNCAAIPPELAESELFGHAKGSFTNAVNNKEGLICAADGGTLFLNEIGELTPAIQAKLLGVLENKKVLRIGDHRSRDIDFRLICATNRDLEDEVRIGKFRQDLYFRVAVMTFELPPLAQRGDDLFELIVFILREYGISISTGDISASEDLLNKLRSYDWPGNIRELRNEVSLLAISYPGDSRKILTELAEKVSSEANQTKIDKSSSLADQISAFERDRILESLAQANYIIRQAAIILKMPEATLRSKIRRHNIVIA
jgi:transcriptional regulator with GAF, ATPase, and Fis domain